MIAIVAVKAAGIQVTKPMCKVTAKGFMGKSDNRWLWSPENTQGRPDCFVSDGFDDYTIWW